MVDKNELIDRDKYINLFNEFKEIAYNENFTCELKSKRFVKSIGPNLYHMKLDIEISK